MLVKAHNSPDKYLEDFGLAEGRQVHFYESGPEYLGKVAISLVHHVLAMWAEKPLKVRCDIADSEESKRSGLQTYDSLDENAGLFFPYIPYTEVTFHQGSVSYPLDIIFLKDEEIIKIQSDTKVGSSDRWSCAEVSGVIEVNAGFCKANKVAVGDRIVLQAVSEQDIKEVEEENFLMLAYGSEDSHDAKFSYMPNSVNLSSAIADML